MIISAGTIMAPARNLSPGFVMIEDGRITRVGAG